MEIKDRISDCIDSFKEDMICDLAMLVSVPSVKGERKDGAPFGEKPKEALLAMLSLCGKYGFATKNIENAIGFADFNNHEETPTLGMLCHMDVVPEGDGWDSEPYVLKNENGMLTGRGTSDDKGPAIAALYAMRAIKKLGIELKHNVRFIIGSDEECGSGDLDYYFKNEKTPLYSFSPDAEFPLINTEKGRFALNFKSEVDDGDTKKRVSSLKSGVAVNAVPNMAKLSLEGMTEEEIRNAVSEAEKNTGVKIETYDENGKLCITINGKAAHASTPQNGNNALTAAISFINLLDTDDSQSKHLFEQLERLFPHGFFGGEGLAVSREDEISGKLTLTLDMLSFDGKELSCWLDSRMPVASTRENTVIPAIRMIEAAGFSIADCSVTPVHHVDSELPFVKKLLSSYEAFTGRKGECIAIGGGTYVHEIENGVAFGSIMPDIDTHMHGANEYMPVSDLLTAAKIYALAIYEICR